MAKLEFKTEKVTDRITRIFCFSTELMYLVEGDKEAALLDSGSGIGFVRPLIEQLTDKPVKVLLTHGHVDHAMGASEFPKKNVYINQEDEYIYKKHCTYEFRKRGLPLMGELGKSITEADFTPIVPIHEYHDLKEGDKFDLGGISVEMYACPGHTRGSLVMLIPEEKMLLLGDACNPFTFVFQDYSTPISVYKKSLETLLPKVAGRYTRVLISHGDGNGCSTMIEENIAICEKILNKTAERIPMQFRADKGYIAVKNPELGHANIVYSELTAEL